MDERRRLARSYRDALREGYDGFLCYLSGLPQGIVDGWAASPQRADQLVCHDINRLHISPATPHRARQALLGVHRRRGGA